MARKAAAKAEESKAIGLQMHMPVLVKAHDLNPAAYNPNKMTPEKYEALKASIRADGFIDPIVVQQRGTNIIGGHHRLRAIKEICVEDCIPVPEVPCIVLDVDDATAKKLNLKLNHIKGEPDARLLGELLVDIFPVDERSAFVEDVALLGFDESEALKYMKVAEPDLVVGGGQIDEIDGFGRSVTLSLEFDDVKTRDKAKKAIAHLVEMEKKKSGTIVAGLIAASGKAAKAKR